MTASNRLIVAILAIAALALAFWMLALNPKREKAAELGSQANELKLSLAEAESAASEATAARQSFPTDYRQLVLLGQAAPAGDETSSLLVELNRIAEHAHVKFASLQLTGSGETSTPTVTAPATPAPTPSSPEGEGSGAVPASATVPPTEAAASLLPLGASIGTAGLGVMPYQLTFTGNFFHIADFIKGIDSLVHTKTSSVAVDGRLLTINAFSLSREEEGEAEGEKGAGNRLIASFSVTAYVTPPSQGVTAGATPSAPPATMPAAAPASEGSGETSQTVSAR